MDDVVVSHNADRTRYEAHVSGTLAGFAEYQLATGIVVLTHTEVDRAYEGRGVGAALARHALDDVRRQGDRKVLALCPFISGWIARHPDYAELLYNRPASVVTD